MKKKVLSIVLALCLAACLIPLMGAASGDVTCPGCGSSEYLTKLDGQYGYKTAQVGDAAKGHYAVYRCTSPVCSQSSCGYWDYLAGDVIPHDYNKWGECTTCWYECMHSSTDRIWRSENGQYWKECGACGREFAKKDIPVVTLNAPDEVCRTQDCTFTFNLPEGCVNPEFGYEFVSVGSGDSAVINNGVCSGTIEAEWYAPDENSFTLTAYVTTSDGFTVTASKVIKVVDGHRGGTADCRTKAVCEICGQPYGDVDKSNHTGGTELKNDKPATCVDDGYTGDICCIGCGDVLTAGKAIPAEGHKGGTADCHSKAICEVCQQPYGDVDKSNHTGGTELRGDKPATCVDDGYTGDTYCLGCNAVLVTGKALPAEGHMGGVAACHSKAICAICDQPYGGLDKANHAGGTELRGDKPATCTVDGYTGDTYCLGCGEILVTGEAIPAEGHKGGTATTTEKAVCEVCGEPYGELLPAPEPTPTPAPTPAPTDKPADDGTPKTGDDGSVTLWLAILLISGGAITVTVRSARKSK